MTALIEQDSTRINISVLRGARPDLLLIPSEGRVWMFTHLALAVSENSGCKIPIRLYGFARHGCHPLYYIHSDN